ncbi:hypothetical protein [Hyphomonas sp.]|uniref:hypothetical protein n=1 Tax=Hyphomonas sp. TaxID=87 RepID=UPI0025C5CB8B|nr:hypothetical protein [Hyphomonas sp.]MBI1401102.1 hypothetical protein [Hyphomonas sp.]
MIYGFNLKAASASVLMALCAVSPGTAQAAELAPSSEEGALINEKVVVTARKPAETQNYVAQVTAPPHGTEQLARWDDRICVGVSGVKAAQAQFIADRVSQRALEVGLRTGKPGCSPEITILVTTEPEVLIGAMQEKYANLFAVSSEKRVGTLGKSAFEQFKTEERPVRWWHVSETRGADGTRISGEARQGVADGVVGAPTVRSEGSRLRSATRQDLSHAIIVVDANLVQGVSMDSLADYIAFVALMQADPNGNTTGIETIMNLFRVDLGDKRPMQMTDWDKDFLRALYSMPRNTVSLTQAQSYLAERMERK